MIHRRDLFTAAAAAALGLTGRGARAADFEVTRTDAEWRRLLPPDAYAVLRQAATERRFTSPLNDEHRKGIYYCRGCDLALFRSQAKFNSGTGWPSFWIGIKNGPVKGELEMGYPEIHCRRCGGHLGHLFDDGPQPTGLRYCMNGVALKFRPTA